MTTPQRQSARTASGLRLPSPTLVDTPSQLKKLVTQLRTRRLVAIDTESDSLFRYYPRVCLIQITVFADPHQPDVEEVTDYLVDPLRLDDIGDLGVILADPSIEVILHAATNDILILQRDFGFRFTNVFDTQLAARILGWPRVGLAAILEEKFDVTSNKNMQRTNWGQRPLTADQIAYAQIDTHYLPALRQKLLDELAAKERMEEAREAFAELEQIDFDEREPSERSFWQLKGTRDVPHERLATLATLWEWREAEAQRQDRPPFKIMNDRQLLDIANTAPRAPQELERIKGLSSHQIRRYGGALLRAIREADTRPQPEPPEQKPRPEWTLESDVLARFDALRQWRTQTARRRGVDPDIVLTNDTLMTISREKPRTLQELLDLNAMGPWKLKSYGPSILKLLNR